MQAAGCCSKRQLELPPPELTACVRKAAACALQLVCALQPMCLNSVVQIMLNEPFITSVQAKVFVAVASISTPATAALC